MALQQVQSPFTIFNDRDGTPLEDGYIYIGVEEKNPVTNPIEVFWDSDGIYPAAQPVRTLAGYPARNGSAATLYVSVSVYSILIQDKNQTLVGSNPNAIPAVFTSSNTSETVIAPWEFADDVTISQNLILENNIPMSAKEVGGTLRPIVIMDLSDEVNFGNVNNPLNLINNGVFLNNGDTVWTSGNDGSGSGLDADLIDGIDSAVLARTDIEETFDQVVNFINGANLNNLQPLQGKESGGTLVSMIFMSGSDNITIGEGANSITLNSSDDIILASQDVGNPRVRILDVNLFTYYDVYSEKNGPLTSFRNKIINGQFDVWQQGTSATVIGYSSDDRWTLAKSGSTQTNSRQTFATGQTDVPQNPKYYCRNVVVTGGGASDYTAKIQRIERVETLSGQPITLSFWAKADSAKNIATEFVQYFGSGGSPSATINSIGVTTHNLTTAWQQFTTTVTLPSTAAKTLGTNSDDYLQLVFWFEAGSDYNGQTNSLGNQSGTFDIANVQVEEGPIATPFAKRNLRIEQELCYRYFYRWSRYYNEGQQGLAVVAEVRQTTTQMRVTFPEHIVTRLRATPSISGGSGAWDVTWGDATSRTLTPTSVGSFAFTGTLSSALTASTPAQVRPQNISTTYIDFNSEL